MSRRLWILAALKAFVVVCLVPLATLNLSRELVSYLDGVWKSGVSHSLSGHPQAKKLGTEELEIFTLTHLCAQDMQGKSQSMASLCGRFRQVLELETWSNRVLQSSILLLLATVALAFFAHLAYSILPFCFVLAHRLAKLTLLYSLITGTLLLFATLYLGESVLWGKTPLVVTLGLGVLMAFLSANLAFAAVAVFSTRQFSAFARSAFLGDHPALKAVVEKAARAAGSEPPDHLLLGMGPKFYITSSLVRSLDGTHKGTTLFLSLPLCRFLSPDELTAVLTREFYQFGRNRSRSEQRFRLCFQDTVEKLGAFHRGPGKSLFLSALHFPVVILMELPLNLFEWTARKSLRESELSADHFAAQKCGNETLARALSKMYRLHDSWDRFKAYMKNFWLQGKPVKNASEFFATAATLPDSELRAAVEFAHETPARRRADFSLELHERLTALGFTAMELKEKSLPARSASSLFVDINHVEESLTASEATGWNRPPRGLYKKRTPPRDAVREEHERETGT